MIYLFFILTIFILLIISIIDTRIKYKKIARFNDLKIIYDSMEIFAIKENLTPTNSLVDYLKNYKFLLVNKEFSDIRIALIMRLLITDDIFKKKQYEWNELKKQVSPELIEMGGQFNKIYDDLIKLSYWNFSFMFFVFKIAIKSTYYLIIQTIITPGKNEAYRVFNVWKELFNNENIILQNPAMGDIQSKLSTICD